MNKKMVSLLLTGCLSLGMLANCVPAAESTVEPGSIELTFATYKADWADTLEEIFDIYKADHPEIRDITVYAVSSEELANYLKTSLATDSLPNIFNVDTDSSGKVWKEYLQEVSDTAAAQNVDPLYLEPYTWDGGVYGVAYNAEVHGSIWNTDWLAEVGYDDVPRTYEEMQDAIEKLEAAGYPGGLHLISNTHLLYHHFLNLGLYLNSDDVAAYNNELVAGNVDLAGSEGWNRYLDWMEYLTDHAEDDVFQMDKQTGQMNLFNDGYAWVSSNGTNYSAAAVASSPEWVSHYRVGPYCLFDDAEESFTLVNVQGFGLAKTGDEAVDQAARELYDWFFTSDEAANLLVEKNGVVPVRDSYELPEDKVDEYTYAAIEEMRNNRAVNMRQLTTDALDTEIAEIMQRFIAKNITKEEALTAIGEAYVTYGAEY